MHVRAAGVLPLIIVISTALVVTKLIATLVIVIEMATSAPSTIEATAAAPVVVEATSTTSIVTIEATAMMPMVTPASTAALEAATPSIVVELLVVIIASVEELVIVTLPIVEALGGLTATARVAASTLAHSSLVSIASCIAILTPTWGCSCSCRCIESILHVGKVGFLLIEGFWTDLATLQAALVIILQVSQTHGHGWELISICRRLNIVLRG